MEIDLSKYTIEEIVSLKGMCESYIYNHKDEYEYICKVRSYGRNWKESVSNPHTLQELCYRYDGYDGIVDVYSTNPNLSHIENYGDLMYIESIEDYENWDNYNQLTNLIKEIEGILNEWDNRDNVPFRERPMFKPMYSQDDLSEYKKKLEEYDMSFVAPKRIKQHSLDSD